MTPKQGIGNLGGVVDVAIAVGPDRRGEVRDYAEDSDTPVPITEPQRFGGLWRGAPPVAVVEEGEEGRSATAETETVCTIDSTPDRPIPTEPNPTRRDATHHTDTPKRNAPTGVMVRRVRKTVDCMAEKETCQNLQSRGADRRRTQIVREFSTG